MESQEFNHGFLPVWEEEVVGAVEMMKWHCHSQANLNLTDLKDNGTGQTPAYWWGGHRTPALWGAGHDAMSTQPEAFSFSFHWTTLNINVAWCDSQVYIFSFTFILI